jgi:hypothetical protein
MSVEGVRDAGGVFTRVFISLRNEAYVLIILASCCLSQGFVITFKSCLSAQLLIGARLWEWQSSECLFFREDRLFRLAIQ